MKYPWLQPLYSDLQKYQNIAPLSLMIVSTRGMGVSDLLDQWVYSLLSQDLSMNSSAMLEAGSHPDYLKVNERPCSVDKVREVIEFVSTKPRVSKKKVVFIDDVTTMSIQACNALLKVLEEPPSQVVFILRTPSLNEVMPTLISRCMVLNHAQPCRQVIVDWLKNYSNENNQLLELKSIFASDRPLIAKDIDIEYVLDYVSKAINPLQNIVDLEPCPDNMLDHIMWTQIMIHHVIKSKNDLSIKAKIILIEWYQELTLSIKLLKRKWYGIKKYFGKHFISN